MPLVTFQPGDKSITVPAGTPLIKAAEEAGVTIISPCGTKGNCGKCLVRLAEGEIQSSGPSILSETARKDGTIQACRATVGDTPLVIEVPPQHARTGQFSDITNDLDRIEPDLFPQPADRNPLTVTCRLDLAGDGPESDLADVERLSMALQHQWDSKKVIWSLPALRKAANAIREENGKLTVLLSRLSATDHVIDIQPGHCIKEPIGMAVDIGTTTVSVQLVSLSSGDIIDSRTDYNGQIACGLDVISRINYAAKPENLFRLSTLVLETINRLAADLAKVNEIQPEDIYNVALSGNTTMTHLLLELPPEHIRLAPYTPTIMETPVLMAGEIGLAVHPGASVYSAPAVGSYIGGDITAGLLCTTIDRDDDGIIMFIDIGTNGELVIGNSEFILACACSAGPAFEGGGIKCGMRATRGAIESVSIDPATGKASARTIGNTHPQGICGSGIISLMAELFRTGWMDPAGKLNREKTTASIRIENRQAFFVICEKSGEQEEIRIGEAEFENIIRAKAAIYSAVALLLNQAEVDLADIAKVYIAGGFGHFLNLEDAVCIGLLPDIEREKYRYIGNASLMGSCMALISRNHQQKQLEIGRRITYVELSTDPGYMDQYTAALFLPHTNLSRFPSVPKPA